MRIRLRDLTADEGEAVEKLAHSRTAPARLVERARIIVQARQGDRAAAIAGRLGLDAETVRKRIHRFNDEGTDGLGDRPRTGRRPRLTQPERSKIIALVSKEPPGRLVTEPDGVMHAEDEAKAAYWTLDP
jgi:transposase